MQSLRESALALAQRGFPVFPCIPNGKKPKYTGWQQMASTNAAEVGEMWTKDPTCNIGVLCGKGLMVLDVDRKGDVNGANTLELLEDMNDVLPMTFMVDTPSGGEHLYFKAPPVGNSVSKLGDGLDIRGKGGYVVGPFSVIDGKYYLPSYDDEIPVANAPEWILALANTIGEKAPDRHEKVDINDEDAAIQRAKEYLKKIPRPELGTQDNTCFAVATMIRDFGVDQTECYHLMLEFGDECDPPVKVSDIYRNVTSAYRNAQNKAGSKNPEQQFTPLAPDLSMPTPKPDDTDGPIKVRFPSEHDLTHVPKRDFILGSRLQTKFTSLLVAPGGTGKSTLAMLEALAVATGRPLTGVPVHKQGKVFIFNEEDPEDEILRRLAAMALLHNIPWEEIQENVAIKSGRDRPLILAKEVSGSGTIITADATRLLECIEQNEFLLTVLDPFVRTHRVNENDNNSIDAVTSAINRIADITSSAISIVHHARKRGKGETIAGDAEFARGASALTNAVRQVTTLATMTPKEAEIYGVQADKASWHVRSDVGKGNMSPPGSLPDFYRMESIALNTGDKVGAMKKIDLTPNIIAAEEKRRHEETLLAQQVLDVLVTHGTGVRKRVAVAAVVGHLLEDYGYIYDDNKVTFQRRLDALFKDGFVLRDKRLELFTFTESKGKVKYWMGLRNWEGEG